MALKIENGQIVGTIDNLQEKLIGEIPIDRLELFYLVNSWGRNFFIYIKDTNDFKTRIAQCKIGNCYDLSRLDTSKITDMDSLFENTSFDGDISQWNVSKVTSMKNMFSNAINFNQDINNWNTSNVTNMERMFSCAYKFNQDISQWDVSNAINMEEMFYEAKAFNKNISSWIFNDNTNINSLFKYATDFQDRYNNGNSLPNHTDEIKKWIINNRERMNDIDLKDKYGEEIDMFFDKLQTNSIQKKEI